MDLNDFLETKTENTDLLIIDGNNLTARANFVKPDLRGPNGNKTGVIYISIKSLNFLLNKFNPKRMIIVFDRGWSQRRLEIYPQYKENRKSQNKTEEEIKEKEEYIEQIKRFQKYIRMLPIQQVFLEKTEADDIIAYILNKCINNNLQDKVVLSSTDSDFFQFVTKGIKIYNPIDNIFIDESYIKNKFNVSSENYLFYKSMLGDKTDNIDSIKGFGPKAAVSVINSPEFHSSLKSIKEAAKGIKGKKFNDFVENFHIIERNFKLIDLTTTFFTEEEQDKINQQIKQEVKFDPNIMNLCEEDGIMWDENFFNSFKKLQN